MTDDKVYQAKKALLDETGVVIYRNHDRLHSETPDGIFTGVVDELGWAQYKVTDSFMPGSKFVIPETTVAAVAAHVAKTMHIKGIRILGDPNMKITTVGMVAHFLGADVDRCGIEFINQSDCELIIPGEIIDWTIGEYIQDANALGKKKALLNVGHFNLEEPGMKYMATWLPDVIGTETPIKFIQSGDSFDWLSF